VKHNPNSLTNKCSPTLMNWTLRTKERDKYMIKS
jgi:hypothetical protein